MNWITNRVGDALGYGSCNMCGKTMHKFDAKEWHSVATSENTGTYIACEKCWQRATMAERHLACELLMVLWAKFDTSVEMSRQRAKMHDAVDRDGGVWYSGSR